MTIMIIKTTTTILLLLIIIIIPNIFTIASNKNILTRLRFYPVTFALIPTSYPSTRFYDCCKGSDPAHA
jgi:hypothetical protein